MKKLISGISALLTAATLITPMNAFVDTTINPDPDNMPNPKQPTAYTQVEFTVDPTYTVTIPAKVELAEGEQGVYSGSKLANEPDSTKPSDGSANNPVTGVIGTVSVGGLAALAALTMIKRKNKDEE